MSMFYLAIISCQMCSVVTYTFYSLPSLINYLDDHPHLFAVDPLLVHFVVHASSFDKYRDLVTKVPLFILLAALAENLSKDVNEKV